MSAQVPTAFFSYSREDSEFALRLAGDLKAAGASVWLDQLDIEPGQRWARAVQDALTASPRMLVILSPDSVASTNVEDEVAFALEEHKTVIPVFYRECKIPFQLRPFQYIDFRTDYDRGLKVMLKTLAAKEHKGGVEAVVPAVSEVPPQSPRTAEGGDGQPVAELASDKEHHPAEDEAAQRAKLELQEREHEAAAEKARLELEELERQTIVEKIRQQRAREQARAKGITTATTGLVEGLKRGRERLRSSGIMSAPTGLMEGLRRGSGREEQQRGGDATSVDLRRSFLSQNARNVAIAVVVAIIVAFLAYRALRPRHGNEGKGAQPASQASGPPPSVEVAAGKPSGSTTPEDSTSKSTSPLSSATASPGSQPSGTAKDSGANVETKPSTPAKDQTDVEKSQVQTEKKPTDTGKISKKAPPPARPPKTGSPDPGGPPTGADPRVNDLYNRAKNGDAQAMSDLGWDYEKGLGVSADFNRAKYWYSHGADAGDMSAMNRLGGLYQNGLGVPKNYPEAVRWFRKAADANNVDGMIRLGFMYSNGLGVDKDYQAAAAWYRKAAMSGSAYAMSNLGFMYQNGYGVERDYSKAATWYRKSAEAGAAPGMFNLGVMYENGYGVARDLQQAANWYRKAAQLGFPEAKKALERMGANPG